MSAEQVTIDLKGGCILCYQPVAISASGQAPSDHLFQILCQILSLNPSVDRYVFPNLPEEVVQQNNWNVKAVTCESCSNKIRNLVSHLRQTQHGLQTIFNDLTQCNQNPQLVQNAYALVRQTESQFQFPFVQHLRSTIIAKIQEEHPLRVPQIALPPADERQPGGIDRENEELDGNDGNDDHNDDERIENERANDEGQRGNDEEQRGEDGTSDDEYFTDTDSDILIRIFNVRSLAAEH